MDEPPRTLAPPWEEAATGDDAEWVADCFREHYAKLLNVARYEGAATDARDVVQDAYAKLLVRVGAHGRADIDNPRAWLVTAVRHLLTDRRRTHTTHGRLASEVQRRHYQDQGESVEDGFMRARRRHAVLDAVRALPADERAVFVEQVTGAPAVEQKDEQTKRKTRQILRRIVRKLKRQLADV